MTTRAEADRPTLYAPITAVGRAAMVAVRISGSRAFTAAERIAGTLPPHRTARLRRLVDPTSGEPIDQALVLCFAAPSSFTGEDVVEVQLHGGPLPLRRLLEALGREPGLQAAGPGDFSRRAFLNGRLDLTQAEAIADLIDAETEAQARLALRQLDGGLAARIARWQQRLLTARAQLEATLDFADEGDVATRATTVDHALRALHAEWVALLADRRSERLRTGLRVALLGPPNAGKSSLLNALARRDVAIVHDRPGTTRDLLEVALDLDGLPITLIDSAGLRATADPVEAEGVRRARHAAALADLRLWLVDGARWPETCPRPDIDLTADDLCVLTKADLGPPPPHRWGDTELLAVSVRTARGLDPLLTALRTAATALLGAGTDAALTRARHRDRLAAAAARVEAALAEPDAVLRAEDLRAASDALAAVTGERGVEALLDEVFGAFCIGK